MTSAPHDPRPRDIRPAVPLPREGVPLPLVIGLLAVLAVGLFVMLNAHRQALRQGDGAALRPAVIEPAPPLVVPPAPRPVASAPAPIALPSQPPVQVQASPLVPSLPRPARVLPMRYLRMISPRAPYGEEAPRPPRPAQAAGGAGALVIDLTSGQGAAVQGGATGDSTALSADDTARATLIHHRAAVIPQGAIIAAVLETPLNSDRPGLARAIVAQDVRGFDGSRLLIPRGSRLIGEFKADASPGKRRVLVMWSRLIRPDGVAIHIASPATDALGGAGIGGHVDTHFVEKFTSAVLQSAMNVGVNVASAEWSKASGSAVYLGMPGQSGALGQQLTSSSNRPATVSVREGAEIAVLVAHDLDFSGTPAMREGARP